MGSEEKIKFITQDLFNCLNRLEPATPSRWGKMSPQQMVEHIIDFFRLSSGKLFMKLVSPPEHMVKLREFLWSEKQFRENTKAPVLPEEPLPTRYPDLATAISVLKEAVNEFQEYFRENGEKTTHPVFGQLDYADWIQLHEKHLRHHLRQFGLLQEDIRP